MEYIYISYDIREFLSRMNYKPNIVSARFIYNVWTLSLLQPFINPKLLLLFAWPCKHVTHYKNKKSSYNGSEEKLFKLIGVQLFTWLAISIFYSDRDERCKFWYLESQIFLPLSWGILLVFNSEIIEVYNLVDLCIQNMHTSPWREASYLSASNNCWTIKHKRICLRRKKDFQRRL